MQNKLIKAQKAFEVEGFKKKAIPEVLQYLKDYKELIGDKTAYNSDVEEYINKHETVSADMQDYLGTEVYLAQHDLRAEKAVAHEKEMMSHGYIPLREVGDFKGACALVGSKSMDWLTNKLDMVGKIGEAGNGMPFFIPKGKRTRGYYLASIDNGFYKPL